MTATQPRALSVAEMQAALNAAWRGELAEVEREETPWQGGKASLHGRVVARPVGGRPTFTPGRLGGRRSTEAAAATSAQPARTLRPLHLSATGASTAPVLLVLAAHSGAGATTVALLVGEAVANLGLPTRLIECADPARSGLAAAADAELGCDSTKWRRGRRGRLEIFRPAGPVNGAEDVTPPRPATPNDSNNLGQSLEIVDAAWPAWHLLQSCGWLPGLLDTADLLVVARATVPGIRQTEQLLATIEGRTPLLAIVGPTKWSAEVIANCDPLVHAAREANRVLLVPINRQLAVTGMSADPLPKDLTAASRELAARLTAPARASRERRAS